MKIDPICPILTFGSRGMDGAPPVGVNYATDKSLGFCRFQLLPFFRTAVHLPNYGHGSHVVQGGGALRWKAVPQLVARG